jgi:hypothetical protein
MRRRSGPGARCLAACALAVGLLVIYVPGSADVTQAARPPGVASSAAGATHVARVKDSGGVSQGLGVTRSADLGSSALLGRRARVQPAPGARHSAAALAAARAELRTLEIGQPAGEVSVSADPNQVTSSNWSGYADDGSNAFSKVSASWIEPSITCGAQEQSYAAFWVGIDGYNDDSVEQDGTLAQCAAGNIYYYTWWEMYPANAAQVIGTTVSPGDPITASVVRSGTSYTLAVTDSADSSDSFTATQACKTCTNSSAEWIAEAPTSESNDQILSLSDFRAWSVTNASVQSGSQAGVISTFPDVEITMVNTSSGEVEAQPQDLSRGANEFDVYWGLELPVVPSRVSPSGSPAGSPVPAQTPALPGHPGGSPVPARTPPPR